MLKEHETHAMLNVIFFFFFKTVFFPSLPRNTRHWQSTALATSSHGSGVMWLQSQGRHSLCFCLAQGVLQTQQSTEKPLEAQKNEEGKWLWGPVGGKLEIAWAARTEARRDWAACVRTRKPLPRCAYDPTEMRGKVALNCVADQSSELIPETPGP